VPTHGDLGTTVIPPRYEAASHIHQRAPSKEVLHPPPPAPLRIPSPVPVPIPAFSPVAFSPTAFTAPPSFRWHFSKIRLMFFPPTRRAELPWPQLISRSTLTRKGGLHHACGGDGSTPHYHPQPQSIATRGRSRSSCRPPCRGWTSPWSPPSPRPGGPPPPAPTAADALGGISQGFLKPRATPIHPFNSTPPEVGPPTRRVAKKGLGPPRGHSSFGADPRTQSTPSAETARTLRRRSQCPSIRGF